MIKNTMLVAGMIGAAWTTCIDGVRLPEILEILISSMAGVVSGLWLCKTAKAGSDIALHTVAGMFAMGISMIGTSEALYTMKGYRLAGGVSTPIEIVFPSGLVLPQSMVMIGVTILASIGIVVGLQKYEGSHGFMGAVEFCQALLAMCCLGGIALAIHGIFGA